MRKIKERSLCLIITEEYCCGRGALDIAKCAIAGGVDMIQLREKNKPPYELIETAKALNDLCKKSGVLFIINDDPILAKKVNADGVHLGQEDLKKFTMAKARKILGNDKIIGLSAGTIEEVERAAVEKIDYIGFGPVFPTKIKDRCVGTNDVGEVLKIAKKPVCFIGGVNINNIDQLLTMGARNMAVIRAISEASDIESASRGLKEKIKKAKNGKVT